MKKVLLILTAILLFTIPVSARARITLSSCDDAQSGEALRNYIIIEPDDTVPSGTVITIEFENASVLPQDIIDGKGNSKNTGYRGRGFSYQYRGLKGEYKWNGSENFESVMPKVKTSQVPYHITRKNLKTVEIKLCGIPKNYAGKTLKYLNDVNDEPYYYIPLTAVVTDGSKTVKAKLNGPVNSFIKSTDIIAANMSKDSSLSTETTVTEQTTETATSEQVNSVSVKIGSEIMSVNGQEVTLDAVPYIQQASASAMIPLRAVSIALSDGYNGTGSNNIVSWDSVTKTAIINCKGKKLEFRANADYVISDGKKVTMNNGVYSEITEGRMFVPFRALGEAFGIKVNWDSESWTASFN